MIIVWDAPKREANLAKHGIDFADIGEEYFLPAVTGPAKDGRHFALGELNGMIVVTFASLGTEGPLDHIRPAGEPKGKEAAGVTKPKYTQPDMDAVTDNPELTAKDIANEKPFAEAFPELAATIRKRGAQKRPTKISTTIRLSPDALERFKADGPGWQGRIDDALRKAAGL